MFLSIITGLASSLLIIIMSFLFGRYIQNKLKILTSNLYISFGVGFLVYIAIINIAFMPVMFFALSGTMLFAIWWIINILLVLFLIWKWKVINVKEINFKQLYIFIIGGVVILVACVYIGILPKSGDQMFYVPWVKGNQYVDHLNHLDVFDEGEYKKYLYQGQGWYYFQTVLLRTTHMDQNFMNLWVFGSFLGFLTSSVMLGFVYTITKTSNTLLMAGALTVAIAAQTFVNLGDYSNMGLTVFVWVIVLLFILAINAIQLEQFNIYILFAIIAFAGWATLSSALFVIGFLYVAILFVLLFRKSKNLLLFLLINGIPMIAMAWIITFEKNEIFFILLSIIFPIWIGISIWLFIRHDKSLKKLSVYLSSYKYWILSMLMASIILLSIYLWATNGMDPWLNFSYKKDGLKLYIDNRILSISRYIIYWGYVIYLMWRLALNWKFGIINKPFDLFNLIVAFVVILFFNPFVASLWVKIIGKEVYYRVAFIVLIPLYISVIIFIAKITFFPKYLKNVIYISCVLGLAASISVPFAMRSFMRANYSSYTGYSKGLIEVGEYINEHNLSNEKMAGDVDGVFAYVNNPLSFKRYSKEFEEFFYSTLDNQLYDNIDKIQQDKINILIKINDNISSSWNPSKYGFNQTVNLSNYKIFIK